MSSSQCSHSNHKISCLLTDLDQMIWFHQQYHGTYKTMPYFAKGFCLVKKFSQSAPLRAYFRNKYHNKTCLMNCTIVIKSGQWFCCFAGHCRDRAGIGSVWSVSCEEGRPVLAKVVPGHIIDSYFQGKSID